MSILDGKKIAEQMLYQVGTLAKALPKRVCFIQFGDDLVSTTFVRRKSRAADRIGIQVDIVHREDVLDTESALVVVRDVVAQEYDGVVIQLPLPAGIDTEALLNEIPLKQDIDMLSAESINLFVSGNTERFPPVAGAVFELLQSEKISFEDKRIVIVGGGRLVGMPVMQLLEQKHIPYDFVDRDTEKDDMNRLLAAADIVITGVGKAGLIDASMIKEGVVLIDAGTSAERGVLAGDVDTSAYEKASFYTPVPGGVGPVTIAVLLRNLFRS